MKDGQPNTVRLEDYQVPAYLVDQTMLHVNINEDETIVAATLQVRRNPESAGGEFILDGGELQTRRVVLDGRELLSNEYDIDDESLTIHDAPESFELVTEVMIKPQKNTGLEGLYKSGGMFCTQCEAQGFRNITWYPDRPDVMSTFRTTIVADKNAYPVLLSNGNDIERGEEGERHWVTWEDPFKKPAYLFALVAGDLQHVEDSFTTMSGREVKLQIFSEAHNIDKVDFAMASLKHAMAWDETTYGREYDLDIFMIVAVESFNMGAMENKGLNIFNTSCVLARPDTTTDAAYQRVEGVVAHEYFHNWSGNRVTCRDWFQLSLKEGFTVLRDQQFSADMGSATVCRVNDVVTLRNAQFPEDAGPMAHPIRPESYIEINNFYTATVYEKGAEVVGMIKTLLGAERFRKGTDLYFARHDGQAVTTEDFVVAMEDANDMELSQFRAWYRQAGTPILAVSSDYDAAAKALTVSVEQSCPATPGQDDKGPYHMPFAIGLLDAETGNDVRFSADDFPVSSVVDNEVGYTAILNLTESTQQFRFEGIEAAPILSLLRGFSAPVKLNYEYSRDELTFLMSHDSDGFARWEAGQRLGVEVINEVVIQIQSGADIAIDTRLIKAFESNLNEAVTGASDKAMLAEMLVLPSETYIAELAETPDIDAIHQARESVRGSIARELSGLLLSVYRMNQSSATYEPSADAVAQRTMKNVALGYLMQLDDTEMVPLCVEQFEQSDNMTDTSSALRLLVGSNTPSAQPAKEKALLDFYNRWVDEALVIDLWFTIQSSCKLSGTLDTVKALMTHEAFDIKNPNRMRSLVVGFASQNNVNFHQASGAGYAFLADRVIELNAINPLVAARVLSPLTRWGKVDADRQVLMKHELNRILAVEGISPDVFEIVSKSLV